MRILRLLLCAAFLPFALFAQPSFIASLYPTQHALNVPADAELRVGLQAPLDPASLSDSSIYLWSDITGLHKLTVTLENGNKNLRIVPRHWRLSNRPPFNAGERVTVTLTTRLRYVDGHPFEGFTWHYTVAVRPFSGGDFKPGALFGGGYSTYFYVSDFNGDGWSDLVGGDDGSAARNMIVYSNDGKGKLNFSHFIMTTDGRGEVVDQDFDGDQDIVYGTQRVVINDGIGRFDVIQYTDWPQGSVKMHDFDNDGIMDFAISNVIHDTVFFGLSDNGKAFVKRYYTRSPIRPEAYYPGRSYDLNNDGRVDLLLGGIREPAPLGFVSFQSITQDSARISQYWETQFVLLGFYGNDFDNDSYIDYIMVGGGPGRKIQYRNDGKGNLAPQGLQVDSTDTNRLRETITCGDWDGDGDIDLAFANTNQMGPFRTAPDVCIYLNDGKGNFSFVRCILLPFQRFIANKLEAVDLDNDGDLDLIGVADGLFYVVANGSFATAVSGSVSNPRPIRFLLKPSYPNPFAQETRTEFTLVGNTTQKIVAMIFDLTGRTIRNWQFDFQKNKLEIVWDGRDQQGQLVPNGLYFLNVRVNNSSSTQKLMVLR
jgi:hypothetical protein